MNKVEFGPFLNTEISVDVIDIPIIQEVEDVTSLVVLSQVNHRSYRWLSDDGFFSKLFYSYHFGHGYFTILEETHFLEKHYSNAVMKMRCCFLLKDNFELSKKIFTQETLLSECRAYDEAIRKEARENEVSNKGLNTITCRNPGVQKRSRPSEKQETDKYLPDELIAIKADRAYGKYVMDKDCLGPVLLAQAPAANAQAPANPTIIQRVMQTITDNCVIF